MRWMKNKYLRRLSYVIVALGIFWVLFLFTIKVDPPPIDDESALKAARETLAPNCYQVQKNWLKQNEEGVWEMYVEGKPFDRGVYMGKLSKELLKEQEVAFLEGIQDIVPSKAYLQFLKYIVAWYNRKLPVYIPEEFQQEIYGQSFFAADTFDFIGPKFHRKLNYHAAHDIGHTMQNLGMVGCSSVSAWENKTTDNSLILGRNFDFSVGDSFAKNKLVCFMKPEQGHPFVMISWPDMIGAISGMNMEGLVVTLNAGPSDMPSAARTPVSILAREMLQYASNIEEALEIAQSREVFVSECFIIASAKDKKTVVIEKTPTATVLYQNKEEQLICTNHFQSDSLKGATSNLKCLEQTSTEHRYARIQEQLQQYPQLDVETVAAILRDVKGVGNKEIGLGNEMALNQLIAHHSAIFKPEKLLVWVSTSPYQLGTFIAYDLKKVFGEYAGQQQPITINEPALSIAPDSLLYSDQYQQYLRFKELAKQIEISIEKKENLSQQLLDEFQTLNPNYYLTYELLGDYYQMQNNCKQATIYYDIALTKAIPWLKDKEEILSHKEACVISN